MSHELIGRRGLLALGAAAVAAGAAHAVPRQDPKRCTGQPLLKPLEPLQIVTARGRHRVQVEVADSEKEREYGLMCRTSLAPDRGMLFVFPKPDLLAFWMRNTLIALDIIYIGADGRVVSIVRNAKPLDERQLPSGAPAQFVLELAAGRADQIGLAPGDVVMHRAIQGA